MNYRNAQDEPIVFRQLQDVICQFPFLAPSVFNFHVSKSELFMQDMSEPEPEAESEAEAESEGEVKGPPEHKHVHVASGVDAQVPDSFLRSSGLGGPWWWKDCTLEAFVRYLSHGKTVDFIERKGFPNCDG